MATSVCRVCLVGDIRMLIVDDGRLLETYEKLTNTKLNAGADNGMPSAVCYVCHRLLHRCHKFSDMAHKSNRILQELLHNNIEVTHATLTMLGLKTKHTLMATPVQKMHISNCSNTTCTFSVAVKEEQVVVKEESTAESEEIHGEGSMLETLDDHEIDNDSNNTETYQENVTEVETDPSNMPAGFYCDICNKQIDTEYNLLKHLKFHRVHNVDKPYSCNRCDKAFARTNSLIIHMRVHTGEKPYSCNSCDKAFTQKYNLIKHLRVHTGQKPYPCNRCDKAFGDYSAMIKHLRVHTGEKPYSCNSCDKAFAQKYNLMSHMRVHTGEKPYTCNSCDKAYTNQNNLKTHIMRSHTEKTSYNRSDNKACAKTSLTNTETPSRWRMTAQTTRTYRPASGRVRRAPHAGGTSGGAENLGIHHLT